MAFRDSIVSGLTLVRDAIRSLGYQAGVTGWSINRDGSAEFSDATIRGNLTVGGTAPNIELVEPPNIPSELDTYYDGLTDTVHAAIIFRIDANDYQYEAQLDQQKAHGLCLGGTIKELYRTDAQAGTPAMRLGVAETGQAILHRIGDFTAPGSLQEIWGTQEIFNPNSPGQMVFRVSGASLAVKSLSIAAIIDDAGTAESWHNFSLGNGWTNRGAGFPSFAYRKVAAPAESIQIVGQMNTGTVTDGTTIATLPVGYRPITQHLIVARDAANSSAYLAVNTSGSIQIFDAAGSSVLQVVPAVIPLDK